MEIWLWVFVRLLGYFEIKCALSHRKIEFSS